MFVALSSLEFISFSRHLSLWSEWDGIALKRLQNES